MIGVDVGQEAGAVAAEHEQGGQRAAEQDQYRFEDRAERQKLTARSWQAGSIPDTTREHGPRTFFGMTQNKGAQVVINVYPPGRRDEMHCHPDSEHTFLVWEGMLTVRGINEGEEVTLERASSSTSTRAITTSSVMTPRSGSCSTRSRLGR